MTRAAEMVMGVLVPISSIAFFELLLYLLKSPLTEYENYERYLSFKLIEETGSVVMQEESAQENKFGIKMISIGIISTGFIIGFLGLMASIGKMYVFGVAFLLLLLGLTILYKALK